MFGAIANLINKLGRRSNEYQEKVEELDRRLRSNKIPKDMQDKVFEYFNYCWRKNLTTETVEDFSDLSAPLQRDLLFFKHQEIVMNVPLFQELEPMEILYIIQNLRYIAPFFRQCNINVHFQ